MSNIDFAAKLLQAAKEADLEKLTPENIKVMKLLQGTCDGNLRDKIMETPEPTWADVDRTITRKVMSSSTSSTLQRHLPHEGAGLCDKTTLRSS